MDLEQLLNLQSLDTRLAQLDHRLAHDHTREELLAAQQALAAVEAEIVELFAERDAVRSEQRRLEDESATVGAKIDKDTASLYDGSVVGHKELEALQAEIAHLRARQSDIDDRVIEQMELAEPLEARALELDERKAAAAAVVEECERAVTIMEAEVGVERSSVSTQRHEVAEDIDTDLLARYDRLRIGLGGQGVARLASGGRCEGCHLTLPSAEYSELKRAPAGEVHYCPECGRILVV